MNAQSSTWHAREYPILLAATQLFEEDAVVLQADNLVERVALDRDQVTKALVLLTRAGYVEGKIHESWQGPPDAVVTGIAERGLRAVQQWPAEDSRDALLQLLDQLVDAADGPDERSRLEKARDAIASMSATVVAGVATAVLSGAAAA